MGFFFRKRIKLLPGVYINLSKNGMGFSFGPKGLKYSINAKGEEYISGGVCGLYARQKINKNSEEKICNKENSENNFLSDSEKEKLMKTATKIAKIRMLQVENIITEDEFNAIKDLLNKMNNVN